MFNFNCKSCIEKDKQIKYLQTLIDNLLQNKGIAPVVNQAETILEESEEEKEDRALREKGILKFGD